MNFPMSFAGRFVAPELSVTSCQLPVADGGKSKGRSQMSEVPETDYGARYAVYGAVVSLR